MRYVLFDPSALREELRTLVVSCETYYNLGHIVIDHDEVMGTQVEVLADNGARIFYFDFPPDVPCCVDDLEPPQSRPLYRFGDKVRHGSSFGTVQCSMWDPEAGLYMYDLAWEVTGPALVPEPELCSV